MCEATGNPKSRVYLPCRGASLLTRIIHSPTATSCWADTHQRRERKLELVTYGLSSTSVGALMSKLIPSGNVADEPLIHWSTFSKSKHVVLVRPQFGQCASKQTRVSESHTAIMCVYGRLAQEGHLRCTRSKRIGWFCRISFLFCRISFLLLVDRNFPRIGFTL
jgi:hypothetical protein